MACPCCGRGSHWHLLLTSAHREGTHAAAWCALDADLTCISPARERAPFRARAARVRASEHAAPRRLPSRDTPRCCMRAQNCGSLAPAHVRCVAACRSPPERHALDPAATRAVSPRPVQVNARFSDWIDTGSSVYLFRPQNRFSEFGILIFDPKKEGVITDEASFAQGVRFTSQSHQTYDY